MWKLPVPSVDEAKAQLERALSRDRGTAPYSLTAAERDAILKRYKNYDTAGGRASAALAQSTCTPELSKALHDAYAQVQQGARLEALRETLKAGAKLCPYCGTTSITDLDHYLPRSTYKDFAIYPRNLVPSCHPCNNIKRAFTGATDNENLIQPYFDQLPAARFLIAELSLTAAGALVVRFKVNTQIGLEPSLASRIGFQLEKFQLDTRLQTAINVFLASFEVAFDLAFSSGGSVSMAEFLVRTSDSHARNFGLNDWRTTLLFALSTNSDFCNGAYKKVLGSISLGQKLP